MSFAIFPVRGGGGSGPLSVGEAGLEWLSWVGFNSVTGNNYFKFVST